MPDRPRNPCSTPGCRGQAARDGRCATCRVRRRGGIEAARGTASQRGYGVRWSATRRQYLATHIWCVLCGAVATIADHHPISRRDLIAAGVEDPDTDERLRPLCDPCHHVQTARLQPGGWHRGPAGPRH